MGSDSGGERVRHQGKGEDTGKPDQEEMRGANADVPESPEEHTRADQPLDSSEKQDSRDETRVSVSEPDVQRGGEHAPVADAISGEGEAGAALGQAAEGKSGNRVDADGAKSTSQAEQSLNADSVSEGLSLESREVSDREGPQEPTAIECEARRGEPQDRTHDGAVEVRPKATLPMGSIQMKLMDAEAPTPEGKPALQEAYLLTNRNNLLEILSSGLIKPASAYEKYYKDIGGFCPGGVVLLAQPPSAELVEQVIQDPETQFPVVMTVDMGRLAGRALTIDSGFDVTETHLPPAAGSLAVILGGAIPNSLISGVHFCTYEDYREFSLRDYSNVPVGHIAPDISADIFGGPEIDVDGLISTLQHGCSSLAQEREMWRRADALAGAITLLASATQSHANLSMQGLAYCLNALRTGKRSDEADPTVFRWAAMLPGLLVGVEPDESPDLLDRFQPSDPGGVGEHTDGRELVEALMFFAAVEYLSGIQPHELSHIEALEAVVAALEDRLPRLAPDVSGELVQDGRRIADDISAVVDLVIDPEEFPEKDSPAALALLRLLLQPEPEHVIDVEQHALGSAESVAIAAMLSGVLYGRSRIPVTCRPQHDLMSFIDISVAGQINERLGGPELRTSISGSTVELDYCDDVEFLQAGDIVLMQKGVTRVTHTPREGVADTTRERDTVATTARGGAVALSEKVRQHLIQSELAGGPEREVAVKLCQEAGWEDCLTTALSLEGQVFLLTNHRGSLEIRIRGDCSDQMKIELRKANLERHLTPEEWEQLPGSLIEKIARELGMV